MHFSGTAIVALLGWTIAQAAPVPSPPAAQGAWSAAPPMHHARAAHAVVSDGKSIYAMAGTGAGGAPVLALERFDGATWRDEGVIPGSGLNAPAAVALAGKIYLIGGFVTDTNLPSAGVLVYDTK
ncbi:MAG TPA: hypothetical protein VIK97_19325, partial [Casimicrobiaceae bacterium]